jgi:MobA-like NTP transferase domain
MSTPQWQALVLGGGDPGDPFALENGVSVKALIDIGGKPMGQYLLEALRLSGLIETVAYVGPLTPEMAQLVDIPILDSGKLLDNLERGMQALPDDAKILILTADIPLLTSPMLAEVLQMAPNAGVVYPIVRRRDCEKAFPGVKRTYGRLLEGTFTGGNLFLVDNRIRERLIPRLREVLAYRKQPLRLAGLFGFVTLLRMLTGGLRISRLEGQVSKILGVEARALITPHAAVGTDVDKESDLELVRKIVKGGTFA